ncbi:MAG TPA: tyrosine-type recombinase/integrase [Mesorhizobium sp.]|nr:tyrosine-type recombinase/integrase [Mesorhizobium sp.]
MLKRRPSLPFVERWRDRHGRMRIYFRRRGSPRIALTGDYGSDEFRASYARALHGQAGDDIRPKIERAGNGTLAALITSYKQDTAFKALRDTTKAGYLSRLDAIRREHGQRSVAGLTYERIEIMLAAYDDRPAAKLDTLKKLRILIKHAMKKKLIGADPTAGIKRTKIGEVRSCTDDEIRQFENRWPIGTKQRTAFALMLFTGQRRSDVHRMTWQDISQRTGRIKVKQQKTGMKLEIPQHRDLKTVLENARHNHVTIVNTEHGKPFTVDGFSSFMRDAIRAAGLPLDCQPHGLRKAAGRRLAEAGCTTKQIMAILGHKSLAEAERYTREADQIRLATDAMLLLEAQTENEVCPNPATQFGQTPKKSGDAM